MDETESRLALFDRLILLGAIAAFLFGPAILFLIRGDLLASAVSFLSLVGIILTVESGLYEETFH